jgi:hypothetical protein
MRYNDHPPPHFHARYGGQEVTIELETGRVQGTMSRNALQLIWAWMDLQRDELDKDWGLARQQLPLNEIPPLD